ncbi:MAG: PAS domain S-box protein [Gammaproteobacteria bacterium]|jgi:PAS domain S-box-containing protein|nr:PAS domain S-box protein [Gammaproteobacteria bacterium]MBT3868267.1 PAS domain S-box protein [Gammaproteobacteria bacterium]MBT4615706.1 PAS domain S-box protein [Gammaproteobacteria bacterium]MBT6666634.1 PAS domain S-box protein [Gammaproteobacteria bacterium]MBT6951716.1 PAS domain S-box protein [Gammaproteobacteria bacterium]
MKTWLKFLLTGTLIGLVFPGAALVWILYVLNEPQTPVNIWQVHEAFPLLFIVDLAPLVLGISFLILGLEVGKLRAARSLIEEEYMGALSVANIPIIMIRIGGMVEGCNEAVEKILGLPSVEIVGKNILTDFVRADAQDEIEKLFINLLQTKELHNLEIPLIDAVGNIKLVLISAKVRLNPLKKVDGFVIFGQDITQLRNQETEINRKQQLAIIGQLTGGVVHDLNNMLNIIAGNIRFLKEEPAYKDTDSEELIEDIESAAIDAVELINRLLSFSRERPAAPSEMPAKTIMEETEKLARRLIKEHDILLTFDQFNDDVRVNIDFVWFKNCLLNLINNAADSMKAGTITVAASVETSSGTKVAGSSPGNLCVSVTDEGCGIPDAELARVLEPFYTTKSPDQGTGLGLAMVDKFCQESGGYCTISSEIDIGTKVSMILPLANE